MPLFHALIAITIQGLKKEWIVHEHKNPRMPWIRLPHP